MVWLQYNTQKHTTKMKYKEKLCIFQYQKRRDIEDSMSLKSEMKMVFGLVIFKHIHLNECGAYAKTIDYYCIEIIQFVIYTHGMNIDIDRYMFCT